MLATPRIEVPIPEFSSSPVGVESCDTDDSDPIEVANSAEAIMDVIAYCNDGTEYFIDVSARNPLANRYRQGASTQPGFACGRVSMTSSAGTP